jgi:hypothetical protein
MLLLDEVNPSPIVVPPTLTDTWINNVIPSDVIGVDRI